MKRRQVTDGMVELLVTIWICRPRNSPKSFSEFAVHRGMYGQVSRSSILSFLSFV
jgi:hypothetical protein